MSDKFRRKSSFTKEKTEILGKKLGQFDEDVKVDPLASEESTDATSLNDQTSIKDRTFLFHVLIETLCYILEKDDDEKRKILFNSIYKSFEENNLVQSVLEVDNFTRMRREVAKRFLGHIKQVHQSISPPPSNAIYEEQESSIPISRVEKYNDAFDELEVIARGGFGLVCKARHKVDGGTYAVKKIIFEYRTDSDYITVMREVRNLSSLSNKYVVAYNNAWVQPADVPLGRSSENLDSESVYTDDQSSVTNNAHRYTDDQSSVTNNAHRYTDDQSSVTNNAHRYTDDQSSVTNNAHRYTDDQSSVTNNAHRYTDEQSSVTNNAHRFSTNSDSSYIVFQDDSDASQINLNQQTQPFSFKYTEDTEESPTKLPNCPIFKIKMMLCIQMEFCDYDLRHWIDARNEGSTLPFAKSVPDIFKEILCGVAYIHEKEIIHRDLKPQNIFFSQAKGVMKVGDFGLATLSHTSSDEEQGNINHSTNLGTLPYAAPEQRSKSCYDSKVDMYSLGIILIELLAKIGTKMEFFKMIEIFKQGIIPQEIEQRWPEYIPLLKNLLEEDHNLRMDAKQVLDMELFKDVTVEESYLEQKVKDLERALANKEQEFQEREKALTQKLQEQEQIMEQRLQEQKWELEQKFQEQKQAFEEALDNKECLFDRIAVEVNLLKEYINRFQ